MKKYQRRLFFWTLVALFLIVAPAVVLHARGYRFDFQRGVFVHSGTISVKDNPQSADIFVDGKLESSSLNRINSSSNINGLIPKSYNLTIKSADFQEWQKDVDVHSGLATEFWNVLLIRNDYEKKEYDSQNIDHFFISPKDKFVAYTQSKDQNQGIKVRILNINNNTIDNEFSIPDGIYENQERQENIEWSPQEDYLSVPIKLYPPKVKSTVKNTTPSTDKYAYFILDPKNKTSFNLNSFLKKDDIRNVRWDPKDKNYLFFLSGNSLFRANITDMTDIKDIADNVSSFDLGKNAAFYSQMPTELVFKSNLDGSGDRTQITNSFPQNLDQPNEKLIVYDDSRIIFINQNKDLFLYNENGDTKIFKKIAEGIEGIQFSDDGKKLLYWSNNEIFVYFLRDWNVQPLRLADENTSITRYAENITNIQWFKDYEHVIFNVGGQFKIIELDPRDHRNVMDLPKSSATNPVSVYEHALGLFFFTNQKDNSTYLNSIILPEKTNFLGF